MSKAFTRESDESGGEEIAPHRPQLPPGTRNYITPQGAERLQARLGALLEKKQAGKVLEAEQRIVESTIRNLQEILDSVVVAQIPADREKIAFGAAVTIRRGNAEEELYRIVGVEEADPEQGSISWISPLARALLSRKAGDKVRFRSPAGEVELTILSVRY